MNAVPNYIHQPPTPRLNLVDSGENIVHTNTANLLLKGPEAIQAENRRRIQRLYNKDNEPRPSTVKVYKNVDGHSIIDLREEDVIQRGYWRVRGELKDRPHETALMRATDIQNPAQPGVLALLETDGKCAVSAQTNDNPHGYFAKRDPNDLPLEDNESPEQFNGSQKTDLVGYGLQDKKVTAINVTSIGGTVVSQVPQAPLHKENGLNHVHTHGMALARFDGEKWSKTHIIPSGKPAYAGANNTAQQYSQTIFEGLVAMAVAAGLSQKAAEQAAFEQLGAGEEAAEIIDGQMMEISFSNGKVNLFRIKENAKRFNKSAVAMGMEPLPEDQFVQSILEIVEQNLAYIPQEGEGQMYIRPYMIGTSGGAGAKAAKNYVFAIEVFPYGNYTRQNIKVQARRDMHRPDSGGDAKAGLNYVIFFHEKTKIKAEDGSEDILCFDRKGNWEEFTTASPFAWVFQDGEWSLHTSRVNQDEIDEETGDKRNNLNSITRLSVIEIAEELGIKVNKRPVHYSEFSEGHIRGLYRAGTAAVITSVGTIVMKAMPEDGPDAEDVVCEFNDATAARATELMRELILAARRGQLSQATEVVRELREILGMDVSAPMPARFAELDREWVTSIEVNTGQLMPKAPTA